MLLDTGESVNIDAQDWNGLVQISLRYIRNPDLCILLWRTHVTCAHFGVSCQQGLLYSMSLCIVHSFRLC